MEYLPMDAEREANITRVHIRLMFAFKANIMHAFWTFRAHVISHLKNPENSQNIHSS
jgi:hypothetical protein